MKPLPMCANGCGVPPCPPSLVICRACMDGIAAKMEAMIRRMDAREKAKEAAR